MNTYYVFPFDLSHASKGSYRDCKRLAEDLIYTGQFDALYVARSRAGEPDATVILEFQSRGYKQFSALKRLSRDALQQACKRRPFLFDGNEQGA